MYEISWFKVFVFHYQHYIYENSRFTTGPSNPNIREYVKLPLPSWNILMNHGLSNRLWQLLHTGCIS